MRDRLRRLSPWTVLTLAGCVSLTAVDLWRDQGPTAVPLLRGTLPNLVAVPTLAFGFLMMRFPERRPHTEAAVARQARWFWWLWGAALAVTLAWEAGQRWGGLVYDPLDLVASGIGAGAAAAAFVALRPWSFLPPTATPPDPGGGRPASRAASSTACTASRRKRR